MELPAPVPDDLFEVHDPELDVNQIMQQIRERVEQRRQTLGYAQQTFPVFGGVAYPSPPTDMPYDTVLYQHLRQLNDRYAQFETTTNLAASPATRVPVLGNLWRLIREQAHSLVLFYVNRAIAHQTQVNRQLVNVLNRLTVAYQEQQRELSALRAELARLKQGEV